jgi:hypothetical protein
VREAIAHLNALADRFALVAVGVRHVSEKEAKNGVLAAILGSSAWVQVPRAVIALARDPDDVDVAHLQVVAGNRTPPGTPGRRLRIETVAVETDDGPSEVPRVVREGESTVDVEDLLAPRPRAVEPSKSATARTLMLETLRVASGQRMDTEKFDALIAEKAGVSAKTVQNLRSKLGANGRGWLKAIPVKDESGKVGRWEVGLTEGAPAPSESPSYTQSGGPEKPDPDRPDPDPVHPEDGIWNFAGETADLGVQIPTPGCTGSGSGSGASQGRNTVASSADGKAPSESQADGLGGDREAEVGTASANGHPADDDEIERLAERREREVSEFDALVGLPPEGCEE